MVWRSLIVVLALIASAPTAAPSKRSKRRRTSNLRGVDVTAEFLGHINRKDYGGALDVLSQGNVQPTTTGLCVLAHTWKQSRDDIFRRLFLGLVNQHKWPVDVVCAPTKEDQGTPWAKSGLPLTLELARDASYTMLQAALQRGAHLDSKPGIPSLLGALLLQDRQRIMTYGHLGLALRKNHSQPIPDVVQQFDLAEHRRLSVSLDEFILGRNDGQSFLPVDLIGRVNDDVTLEFIRMAEPFFEGESQQYLFNWVDVPHLVTKSLPDTLAYVLKSMDLGWQSISTPDAGGLTPFHYAQVQPSFEKLVSHLNAWALEGGHDPDQATDLWGRSASDNDWEDSWQRQPRVFLAMVEASDGAGWATASAEQKRPICEIVQVEGLPTAAAFHKRFASVNRPVLMRGAARGWKVREMFKRANLLSEHGDNEWKVGEVPYAKQYGMEETRPKLRDFVQHEMRQQTGKHPYIFQNTRDPGLLQPVLHDMAPLIGQVPWKHGGKMQFYLGPAESGAPMHYHGDAINVLAHGSKHWYLQPPHQAEYHTHTTFEWITDTLPSYPHTREPIECTQQAGDIMYVPRGWGHATYNREESIGVAVEFSQLYPP